MANLMLDDERTLQAIGILADSIDHVARPPALETIMASKALRQVLATRSEPALAFAARAFDALDPALRGRIAQQATESAQEAVEVRRGIAGFFAQTFRKDSSRTRSAPGEPQPTGFLDALNTRGRNPKPR